MKYRPKSQNCYSKSLEKKRFVGGPWPSLLNILVDRSLCASCRLRRRSDAASVRRHHVSRASERGPASASMFCSRLDSDLANIRRPD